MGVLSTPCTLLNLQPHSSLCLESFLVDICFFCHPNQSRDCNLHVFNSAQHQLLTELQKHPSVILSQTDDTLETPVRSALCKQWEVFLGQS